MAMLIAMYKKPADVAAFERHYFDRHVPIAKRLPGLKSYEVSRGPVVTLEGASPYHLIAMLTFDSVGTIQAALASALADVPINRYPDGGSEAAKRALRSALALADDVALLVGNGSDEVLQLVTTALARPGAVVLAPEPTFVMYRLYAICANVRYV